MSSVHTCKWHVERIDSFLLYGGVSNILNVLNV